MGFLIPAWLRRYLSAHKITAPTSKTLLKAGVAAATEGLLIWAVPALAVFGALALVAGSFVGFAMIACRGGLDEFALLFGHAEKMSPSQFHEGTASSFKKTENHDGVEFGKDERFKALFELRYHPHIGNYPNKAAGTKLYQEFWNEIKAGKIDYFQIIDWVRRSGILSQADRDAIVRDLMALVAEVLKTGPTK